MKQNAKILLVEDDPSLGFMTKEVLQNRGYEVFLADTGELALEVFHTFDLCILDITLPCLDGFCIAQRIRLENAVIPIIFLTAKCLQEDKLKAFQLGGDDYLTKPFSVDELVCRMEVFLRRNGAKVAQKSTCHQLNSYQFDCMGMSLSNSCGTRKLTRREADLLQMLLQKKGEIVNRNEILTQLWGGVDYFKGRSLDVFISRLRKYLSYDDHIVIENIHSIGFRLIVFS